MFSCKRWTSTNFDRLELTVKLLALPKRGGIILKSIYQTKEKCDPLVLSRPEFWMAWRYRGTVCVFLFLFYLFRTKDKEGHLDESEFCYYYGNVFESSISKVTWSQLCSKFLLCSKKHCSWIFYRQWNSICANSFIKTSVNTMKRK